MTTRPANKLLSARLGALACFAVSFVLAGGAMLTFVLSDIPARILLVPGMLGVVGMIAGVLAGPGGKSPAEDIPLRRLDPTDHRMHINPGSGLAMTGSHVDSGGNPYGGNGVSRNH